MGFPSLFYSLIFGSALLLFSYLDEKNKKQDFEENPGEFLLPEIKEYDFIVVGCGTAGSVVVNKLSEKFSVLVLEAGGAPFPLQSIPIYYHKTFLNSPATAHEWTSVKQRYLAVDEGIVKLGQGKGLGGTTLINGMAYNRGHPRDYDFWAEASGNDSWKYENLVQFFKATENFHTVLKSETNHLGFDGPLYITNNEQILNKKGLDMLENWENVGKELGFKISKNSNWPQSEGFGTLSKTIKNGRRWSAYDSFIKPILGRENLTISKYSEVQKVDIDENGRAVGVHYLKHGIFQYAKARKEIILSAGGMNSPFILMKSGIGPQKDLEEAGIDVKADLPVGQKFQDHTTLFCNIFKLGEDIYKNMDVAGTLKNFTENGLGPLANAYEIYGQSFIVSSEAKKEGDTDYPDFQFTAGFNSSALINGDNTAFILIHLGRPKSRGTLKISKNEENLKIIWDPNYLGEERDIKVLVEGLKLCNKIVETESFKRNGGKVVKSILPECKQFEYGSDQYLECYVKMMTSTCFHPAGTCKMGKPGDPFMVVDSELKVKGIQNLRVIDNSIQPRLTNGNTQGPAYLIGQKGADMILKTYSR